MPFQEGNQYGKTTKRGEGKITLEIRERLKGLIKTSLAVLTHPQRFLERLI